MDEQQQISALAKKLKERGVDQQSGLIISLEMRKGNKRARLMQWMEDNPEATAEEIMEKSSELYDEK